MQLSHKVGWTLLTKSFKRYTNFGTKGEGFLLNNNTSHNRSKTDDLDANFAKLSVVLLNSRGDMESTKIVISYEMSND